MTRVPLTLAQIVPTSKEELAYLFTVWALPILVTALVTVTVWTARKMERVYGAVFDPQDGLKEHMRVMRTRYHAQNNAMQGLTSNVQMLTRDVAHLSEQVREVRKTLEER